MRILNFGSLNLDYVYQVSHFLAPGETLAATSVAILPGGKGLNQSIALARAGVNVWHAGTVGDGSAMLTELLQKHGVDDSFIRHTDGVQGNAVIQVVPSGENAILLCGGSNREITPEQVRETICCFDQGDWLILQNEVSCLREMIEESYARKMHIVFNPSPFEKVLLDLELAKVEWLFINEVEGEQMTGHNVPEEMLASLRHQYPAMNVVLTLGKAGAICDTPAIRIHQPIFSVNTVDTTAAGDTFTGYFIAAYTQGKKLEECMRHAAAASAISVSRPGASISIPAACEVEEMLSKVKRM